MKNTSFIKKIKDATKKQKILGVVTTVIILTVIITGIVFLVNKDNKNTKEIVNNSSNNKEKEIEQDNEKNNKEDNYIEPTDVKVEAVSNTPFGISTDTKLRLTSKTPMREESIKKNLRMSPNRDYSIEKVNDKEYLLAVDTPFENNQIVKVNYATKKENLGWAFQTVKKFNIAYTHPSDEGYNVPIDSGIEIQFTKNIGDEKIDSYFEIKPSVKGQFKYENNKVIFMPNNKLKKNTKYQVTVRKGYSNKTETINEDYTFTFKTDGYNYQSEYITLYGATDHLTYLKPNMPQLINCYIHKNDEKESKVDISIYKFNNKNDFIKGYNKKQSIDPNNYVTTISSSEKYSYTITPGRYNYNHNKYLELQNLEEGYYFLTAKFGECVDYMFVQISPYNAYTAVDKDKFLVWMVDGTTSQLVNDAKIILDNKVVGKTNEDGIAFVNKEEKHIEDVVMELQVGDENPLIMPLEIEEYHKNPECLYWSHIYFDRGLYLPTDEINIFGFVQHRMGKDVKDIKVQMYNSNNTLMEEKEVKLSKIGCYKTSFKVNNYLDDYVKVKVIVDNNIVEDKWVDIGEFEKPIYKMKTSLDKDFIMMGDSITYSSDTSFYEGTPVANAKTLVNSYNIKLFGKESKTQEKYTGNEKGHKEVILKPYVETKLWKPIYMDIQTNLENLQKRYIIDRTNAILFPRDIMVETEDNKISDNKVEIKTIINYIDLNNFSGKIYDYDSYRGKGVPSKEVDVDIVETYYEKIYEGKGYDFINKVSFDKYSYEKHENTVDTISGVTDEDGILTFSYDKIIADRGYCFVIKTKDTKDRFIQWKHNYSIASHNNSDNYFDRYSLNVDKWRLKKNDSIKLTIEQGYEQILKRDKDKSLIFICKDGIMDYVISDDTQIDMKFLPEYIPNANIYVVYFDGKSLHNDYNMSEYIYYNYDDEELNINIGTEKKDYRPGDKVKISINVTDKDNNPISTDVNISVVNEAFFAICEDNTNVLSNLYRSCFSSGLIGEYLAAYNIYDYFEGAECGGEGDADYIRSDFKNTASFDIVTTDENGNGYKEITLPDDLTSWRITCTAIDNKIRAGKEKYNINAKLPFFISTIINDSYLEGDLIEATVKTAGEKLNKDDSVDFSCVIEKENKEIIKLNKTGKSHEYINIPIGKLEKGKHKITISATMGKYKDGEQFEVNITDTLHYFDVIKKENLTNDMKIISNNQYVHLDFFNKEASDHYYELLNIYRNKIGKRSEYQIASYMAGEELNKKYNKNYKQDKDVFKDYISYNGLYRDFVYGNSSAEITANLISIGYIQDIEKLKQGLLKQAKNNNTTKIENIAALWGLSMLGEPVLLNIESLYNEINSQKISIEKMYMMLTLIESGELQKGKALYNDIKKNYLKKKQELLYIEFDNKYTALMMLAAIKLDLIDDAKGMHAYLQINSDVKDTTITQQLYYLQKIKPKKNKCGFQFDLNGKKEKVSLGITDNYSLDLTPKEANSIRFSNIEGNVRVIKDYIGTVKDINKTDKYSIEKWYTTDNKSSKIKQGEIVTVHIKVNVLDNRLSSFIMEDILPAGLAYLGNEKIIDHDDRSFVWGENKDKQTKLHAYIYGSKEADSYNFEVTYKARAILPGEYKSEPVVIRDNTFYNISYSDEAQVKINGFGE
jgi:hypothetical protein